MSEKLSKSMKLLKLAEERASLQKKLNEEKKKQQIDSIPYLPKECISNILIRLPLDSLQQSRFVCKTWYEIINTPTFIDANLHQAETVLIFLTPLVQFAHNRSHKDSSSHANLNMFSIESKIFELKSVPMLHQPFIHPMSKFSITYMEISKGKSVINKYNATCLGQIRASFNGLIVIDNKMKKGELIIMNPITRELSLLPIGTICLPYEESFALTYCVTSKEYKLVHLFRDEFQLIGCEILRIGDKSWKVIDGPCFGIINWFGYEPIYAIGAVHWVPDIDHNEHIVSVTIDDEKFHKIALPKSCRFNDRLMEVSEHLCFVTHEEMNEISIWILKSLIKEEWTKVYTIAIGCIRDLVPLYFARFKWEVYFMDKDGSMFAFNFQENVMRKVEVKKGSFGIHGASYLLHANTLVSWQAKES